MLKGGAALAPQGDKRSHEGTATAIAARAVGLVRGEVMMAYPLIDVFGLALPSHALALHTHRQRFAARRVLAVWLEARGRSVTSSQTVRDANVESSMR